MCIFVMPTTDLQRTGMPISNSVLLYDICVQYTLNVFVQFRCAHNQLKALRCDNFVC